MAEHFLHQYCLANSGKALHKWIHYFDIYEHHFERFRNKNPSILEIGVAAGGSLEMWRAYFGEGAKIIGLDLNPDCQKVAGNGIEIFTGSQDDRAVINEICRKYAPLDIVIDDGSHRSEHMVASFESLYDKVSTNGVYLVEDCYSCYRSALGGGLRAESSFIEYAKRKIDELHAAHDIGIPLSQFTRTTKSVCFYDSVVVFERAPQGKRQSPATFAMSRALSHATDGTSTTK